ncbi:MAG: class I SAM-dependent RNA methyltransferase [Bdellovibrio sp.]|jgi:23S rRNA G2445 N2-methylase RlmL
MPKFFAVTSRGLQEALVEELTELGAKYVEKGPGGAFFESSWEGCYRVNLESRLASRVLKPVLDFTAYDGEELYGQIRRHDFTKYINNDQTLKVESSVQESKLHDQRFVAMKVKDAIVDQFREQSGERPDIETSTPDFRVFVRGYKNNFQVSIDTSGDALFMRGYRREAGLAPMKENLAAGLIRLTGWQKDIPIVDPMCGSGTILIEAALMAMNVSPGSLRRGFGFENLKDFEESVYDRVIDEVATAEKAEIPFKFYGFDTDRKVLQAAKDNARRAGVDHLIEFKNESIATLAPPVEKGLIITNPPYGARIGDEDNLKDLYRDLGHTLKHRFQGWQAWLLSGNKDLILEMKLKASRRHTIFNGPLECKFLCYDMFAGAMESRTFKREQH